MKITGIDHIGIAVKSIDGSRSFWSDILNISVQGIETVEEQKVTTAFLPLSCSEIELLEASAHGSTIQKFIEKRGQGIHHIALKVENLEEAIEELKTKGVRLINDTPRRGAGNKKIAFIHPESTGGVLLELTESK